MKIKIQLLLLYVFCASILAAHGDTYRWNGKGNGTSWNDADNWNNGIPGPGDLVIFPDDAYVTGYAPNNPAKVQVNVGATVTLDLDLTIDDVNFDDHGIKLQDGASLILGSAITSRTFNINKSSDSKDGILIDAATAATLTIESRATLNISNGARNGIKIVNAASEVVNEGTISITINDTENKFGSNAIELLNGGIFRNLGDLTIVRNSDNNNSGAIHVGSNDSNGQFINVGTLSVSTDISRGIIVYPSSIFRNFGFIDVSAGNANSAILVRGELVNTACHQIELNDGRLLVNEVGALFTNNGLITSSQNVGVRTVDGSSVNNAFYQYNSTNSFSNGPGTKIDNDNGIDLNDAARTTIDAAGACTVDIAQATYRWKQNGKIVASSDKTGLTTIYNKYDPAAPLTLSCLPVSITVQNVCADLPAQIPTLGQWAIIVLGLLIGIVGLLFVRINYPMLEHKKEA